MPPNNDDDQYGALAGVSGNVVVSMAGETLLMFGFSSTSVDSSLMLGTRQAWPLRASVAQVVCAVAQSVVAVVPACCQMRWVSASYTSPAATCVYSLGSGPLW